ncbi:hypothetical protein C6P45_002826 [Maudiozyma exigua]|uniref:DUF659 domain-containing protein n=1 Tax=Maudiozyma exigua TaxID=34358 RepID=A0A9P6VWA5_MAUEX|nr:hypothetical protein C6P45_002826 [Kazachstania exigua]
MKIAIPIHYKFAVHKIKPFHGDILEEVAIERHMSHFVTSCCTDNASNVLGATEKLLTDKNFSAFSIHPECAIHQIQLFAKDLIDDMEGIFKRYSASSLNVTDTIETELQHFLANFEGYLTYSNEFSTVKNGYKYACAPEDYNSGYIMYELLKPFEKITRSFSEKKPMTICYLPMMLDLKHRTETIQRELSRYLEISVIFESLYEKFRKYFATVMKGDYILYACGLLHFDSPAVISFCNSQYIFKTDILAKLVVRLLKFTLKENKTSADNPIETQNKFSFDNEEDYSGKFTDINQYVSSIYPENSTLIDIACKEHIERILEGEFRNFNKYRAVYTKGILRKITTKMNLELNLTGGVICGLLVLLEELIRMCVY